MSKAAYLSGKGEKLVIHDVEKPVPLPGQVLIRNHFIASNPVDWKIQDSGYFVKEWPVILGEDVSGEVEAVGQGVTHVKVGDRVWAYTGVLAANMSNVFGALQTHTIAHAIAVQKVPEGISLQEASTLGLAIATAGSGLFTDLRIALPSPNTTKKDDIILVWGGSSSVGSYAIQLARLAGYRVFTTSSQLHFESMEKLGVERVFDHRADDVVAQIREAGQGKITHTYDAISENGTDLKSVEAMDGKGKLLRVLTPKNKYPEGITSYDAFAVNWFKPENDEVKRWFFPYVNEQVASGGIKIFPPPQLVGEGLGYAQQLLDKHRAGVSGVKLIISV